MTSHLPLSRDTCVRVQPTRCWQQRVDSVLRVVCCLFPHSPTAFTPLPTSDAHRFQFEEVQEVANSGEQDAATHSDGVGQLTLLLLLVCVRVGGWVGVAAGGGGRQQFVINLPSSSEVRTW